MIRGDEQWQAAMDCNDTGCGRMRQDAVVCSRMQLYQAGHGTEKSGGEICGVAGNTMERCGLMYSES